MKIAIIISGYLRSFEHNIETLKENLLNIYDVDIYIHITNNNEKKYVNYTKTIDEINKNLNPKVMIVTENIKFNNEYNDLYNQNYKFYILNKKRQEIEKIENIKYDVVIKFRPDIYLQEKFIFNNNLEEDIIYIPIDTKIDKLKLKNPNDKYICDMIAYGPSSMMDKYFELYSNLNDLIAKYGNINETILYNYLNDYCIPFKLIDIKYFVVLSLINTIAITGDSGVGKTQLSVFIQKLFNSSFILECDRYHKWERGNDNWNNITHLNPEANYITKMNEDVFDLKIGNNIFQVDYDHNTGKFTDKQSIESRENIIVCGLHTFYMNTNVIDIKIYIDATDNVKIPWKLKRDILKRGYTIDKIIKQINDRRDDYIKYIFPQKEKADIIILYYNNDDEDDVFDIETFNIDNEIQYKFKIGINKKYNLTPIIQNLNILNIKNDDLFYFISFEKQDFENVIQKIIISFFNL